MKSYIDDIIDDIVRAFLIVVKIYLLLYYSLFLRESFKDDVIVILTLDVFFTIIFFTLILSFIAVFAKIYLKNNSTDYQNSIDSANL